ncbi:MAG: hypothetical protein HFE95_06955, partial [Acutalibacter sp.]|nr:hypothetical protein [Acutalibacter sp.]
MKQSKLLKKSLAALLAILMVAAMIPMSAFAADPDKILVDGEETTLSEAGYSVDLAYPSDTVKAKLSALEIKLESMTGTKVAIFGANGQQQGDSLQGLPSLSTAKRAVNLTTKAVTKPETGYFGTYTLELRVTEAGAAEPAVRTLTINVTERAKSTDTTIAKVTGDKVISADINNTDKVITIVKPIGVADENMTGITYTATDKGTGVYTTKDGDTVATGIGSVWVRAESGATQQYTVKTVIEDIFTDFTVPSMVEKKVTITHSDPTPTAPTTPSTYDQISIDIKVPYGTDLTKIIPTYTVSDSVKLIQETDNNGNVAYDRGDDGDPKQSSGVAAFNFSSAKTFFITTDKGTGNVIVTITEAKNTAAELSSVQVGDFTPTEVERTNQTVYVTDSTPDTAFGENTTEDVVLNVSEGSTVTITSTVEGMEDGDKVVDDSVNTTGKTDANDGIVTFASFPVGKFSKTPLKLVVTSKDGKTNTTYNLTFAATPTTKAPVITGMTLIDETNKKEYSSDSNGVITVPYDTVNAAAMNAWKVRVDVDGGATVVSVQPPYAKGTYGIDASSGTAIDVAHKRSNGADVAVTASTTVQDMTLDSKGTVDSAGTTLTDGTLAKVVLHAYWGGDTCFTAADSNASPAVSASDLLYNAENKPVIRNEAFEKRFTIKKAKASANNTVDSIKLTTVSDISAVNEKNTFTGIIDQDNKLVRINVPADFKDTSKLFILDYSSDAKELRDKDGTKAEKLVASTLGDQSASGPNQISPLVAAMTGSVFTADEAAASTFDPKTTTAKFKAVAENADVRTYQIYAVKAKASAACTLNGITSETAGVKVELDESIANSNRYIITVPASFNTKTYEKGVTPEFDLKFDISEGATLNNWAGPDITEKKFAVAGEKLFWNGAAVTGNTMTVTAENGSSSNNYTFIIKVAEPETDATLKSIKVGETEATAEEAAYTAVIADDTADLTKQILTIETTSPVAKVQIDGKDFDKT